MKWLFRLVFRGLHLHVQHLEREIAWLRVQMQYERQRAAMAIDQCRVTHLHIGPVTMPPQPLEPDAADVEIKKLLSDPSLAGMGSVEHMG